MTEPEQEPQQEQQTQTDDGNQAYTSQIEDVTSGGLGSSSTEEEDAN